MEGVRKENMELIGLLESSFDFIVAVASLLLRDVIVDWLFPFDEDNEDDDDDDDDDGDDDDDELLLFLVWWHDAIIIFHSSVV